MRNDNDYLSDILECISRIENYTISGREAFLGNQIIQDAVIRNFEIIGEATKRLSLAFKQANPNVPWRQIAGFRDVLIHDYIYVDNHEVWNIIEQSLPDFKEKISEILNDSGEEI
ncbi:MAG: DUF86 domain-containing protein [Scytolyngbya sp. HA4215-MV1]|nr:DUF86 domain-containing protein [Scytolyngbya sp. HA4215-MV1]